LIGIHRKDPRPYHRLHVLEAFDPFRARAILVGDRIAHLHFAGGLDAADDVADIAGLHFGPRADLHLQDAHFVGVVDDTGIEELHLVAFADGAVHHPEIRDDPTKGIEDTVEDQGLQWSVRIAFWCRDPFHHGFEHLVHP